MNAKIVRACELCFFLLLAMLCGCNMSPYPEDHVMVVTQSSYAYPGGGAAEHDSCSDILETDNYGRVLFALNNGFGGYSIGIRQKNDDKYVYYYDNVSFILGLKNYKEYNNEELELLKAANDWNEPLNDERMVKRIFVDRYSLGKVTDFGFDQKYSQSIFHATIEDKEGIWTYVYYFDASQTGQLLCNVVRRINTSTTGDFEYEDLDEYLMILNADGTYDPDNYLLKIDDKKNINELLAEIKERNGWVG